MTRKEELRQRAMAIGRLGDTQKGYPLAFVIYEALQQVEREVLERVEQCLDEADHMVNIRDWLYDQQQEQP